MGRTLDVVTVAAGIVLICIGGLAAMPNRVRSSLPGFVERLPRLLGVGLLLLGVGAIALRLTGVYE